MRQPTGQTKPTTELEFTVIERAVLYARVSGDDTKNESRNLQGQLDDGREFAQERGYSIVAELAEDDRGASGAAIDLPKLNRIREMANNREFDVLIVRELDRLSRNLAKQLIVEDELKRAGVRVEYVLAQYENTLEGTLSKQIRAVIAEYERGKIAERLQRGKENASKNGKVIINIAPFGYELVEGGLVENEREAAIVRQIFRWYLAGGTLLGIAAKLDRMGIIRQGKSAAARKLRNSKRKEGNTGKSAGLGWTADAVRRILTNETYTGTFYYGKKKIPVSVPEIVSKELFESVQQQLEDNKRLRGKQHKHFYVLGGMIVCGHCGNNYAGITRVHKYKKRTAHYASYVCNARRAPKSHVGKKCTAPIVKVEVVDRLVWGWLKDKFDDLKRLEASFQEYNERQAEYNEPILRELETVNRLIDRERTKFERATDAYLEGILEKDDIIEKKQTIQAAIDGLERRRTELKAQLADTSLSDEQIESLLDFGKEMKLGVQWADKHPADRRRLLIALKTKVVITHADTHIADTGKRTRLDVSCVLGSKSLDYDDS